MKIHKFLGSITRQITLLVVCLVLPLNILVLAATGVSMDAVQRHSVQSIEATAALYRQQLDGRLTAVNSYFYNLNEDSSFTLFIQQRGDDSYRLARSGVIRGAQGNLSSAEAADGYFFYAPKQDDLALVYEGGYAGLSMAEVLDDRAALRECLGAVSWPEAAGWQILEAGGSSWLFRFSRRGDFYYGAILSLTRLYEDIASTIPAAGAELLLAAAPGEEEKGMTGVWEPLNQSGLWLHIAVPRSEVVRSLPAIQWVALVLACLYLLLIPALLLILNRRLLRPLLDIRRAMLKLGGGDQDYRLPEREPHLAREFNDIHRSFNQMAGSLHTLKIQNYEAALQKKELELKNLQLQIRPHFLLNTFNLIYSLAQLRDYKSIQKFVLYLTDYFRYLFREGASLAPFSQELDLIEKYLDVSAIRYPDCFTVTYDIDPKTHPVPVPPLLLHNFVENVFKHAMRLGEDIHIRISARLEAAMAAFTIEDDGAGMDPATVRQLNGGSFGTGTNAHIGLQNSLRRLETVYGRKGLLWVDSAPGEGTRFTIRIPWENPGNERKDQNESTAG